MPAQQIVTQELGRYLCELSHELNRKIGVLIDRKGTIVHVVVGDHKGIFLPDIGRFRAAANRLRGLRYVHTHLRGEPFTPDDMADLALLRFDVMVALDVGADGLPGGAHVASLLPDNPEGRQWDVQDGVPINRLEADFLSFIQSLENEFQRTQDAFADGDKRERAILISVTPGSTPRRGTPRRRVAEPASWRSWPIRAASPRWTASTSRRAAAPSRPALRARARQAGRGQRAQLCKSAPTCSSSTRSSCAT